MPSIIEKRRSLRVVSESFSQNRSGATSAALARHGARGKGKTSHQREAPRRKIGWSHWGFLLIGFLAAGGLWLFQASPDPDWFADQDDSRPSKEGRPRWGRLLLTPITLEWATNSIPPNVRIEEEVHWAFEGKSKPEIESILQASGLSSEQRNSIATEGIWTETSDGWVVAPPRRTVEELGDQQRESLHRFLSASRNNVGDRFPFRIKAAGFEEWIQRAELPEAKQALIRRLAVTDGDFVSIYDLPLLFAGAPPDETRLLLQALGQVPTYLVRLRVEPGEDTARLLEYWRHGGRGREIEPLLDSKEKAPR